MASIIRPLIWNNGGVHFGVIMGRRAWRVLGDMYLVFCLGLLRADYVLTAIGTHEFMFRRLGVPSARTVW